MSIQSQQVYEYLDAHPIRSYDGTIDSLLNMLCSVYMESNPIENDDIRKFFDAVDSILSKLSLDDNNSVFNLIVDLCIAYERNSFIHGISLGMHLMTELNALP
jgi:hypothetical protein